MLCLGSDDEPENEKFTGGIVSGIGVLDAGQGH
jgi:hypothetical protein